MSYIATTALSQFWNINKSLILLGPWCLPGLERFGGDVDYHLSPSPWKDQQDLIEGCRKCEEVFESTVIQLTVKLNEVHSLRFSEKFWRIYLEFWLFHFIQCVYDRYVHTKAVIESGVDLKTTLMESTYVYAEIPSSIQYYGFLLNDDWYNLGLYSHVFKFLGVNGNNSAWPQDLRSYSKKLFPPVPYSRAAYRNVIERILKRISSDNPILVSGPRAGRLRDHIYDILAKRITFIATQSDQIFEDVRSDRRLRKQLALKPTKDEFQNLVNSMLMYYLPACYIEKFHLIRKKSAEVYGRRLRHIVSWAEWGRSEVFSYYAGLCAEYDNTLVAGQHGGGYGQWASAPLEYIEVHNKDVFLTWGWNPIEGSGKHRVFPDRTLCRLRDTYIGGDQRILYLSTTYLRYGYRLFTNPSPHEFPLYIQNIIEFFKSLSGRVREKILFKPHSFDNGWNLVEQIRISGCLPKLYDLPENSTTFMKKARLVVIDHPSTSQIESMVINVPTILFWNSKHWMMREEAVPYFDQLREVGILMNSPCEAAQCCERVLEDPLSWWHSKPVQEARLAYIDRYGCTSKGWKPGWKRLQRDILNGGLYNG